MGERVAVDRSHVHPKGVRVRKSTVMVHGCEPNCPAVLLLIFKLFSCVVVWLIVLMVQMHVASPIFEASRCCRRRSIGCAPCYQAICDGLFRSKICVSRQEIKRYEVD
jgi:hypothetical protein